MATFVSISLIWAFVLFFGYKIIYKRKFKKSLKGYSFIIPILGLVGIAILLFIGIKTYEYTESPEFCALYCHSMEPYVDTYEEPGNNTILAVHSEHGVECAECHNGPGIIGTAETRINGLSMVISEITGDYDPDEFKAHVPNTYCEKSGCHDNVDWLITTTEGDIYHPYTNEGQSSPVTGEGCIKCHNPRLGGTGLTKASCSICHDITPDELEAHEARSCGHTTCHSETVEAGHKPQHRPYTDACINCHNRKHPEDARLPYSIVDDYRREGVDIVVKVDNEFCGDCHNEEYELFLSYDDGQCRDCHVEHKVTTAPHVDPVEGDYICSSCHNKLDINHNPNDITFRNYIGTLENEFCFSCHSTEYNAYILYNDGNCIDCHFNHDAYSPPHILPDEKYEDCYNCHIEQSLKHNPAVVEYEHFPASEISNEFCSSCHYTQYETLSDNNDVNKKHFRRNCVDCHGAHYEVQVDFDKCTKCHGDKITPIHTKDTYSCMYEGCHDLNKFNKYVHEAK
ncbi:MAG: NapC/NirT family cytochrome c [Thermoplasmata archaeon]|nr:MAG: NapC/NirT family cytochrome c [Thermoplasmata archaeon]